MNRLPVTAAALVLALAAAGAASAQRWSGNQPHHASGPIWDTARVLSVDPILAPSEPIYRQQCWQEPVRVVETVRDDRYWRDDRRWRDDGRQWRSDGGVGPNTNAVLGGIVGAAIGNQIGDGDGRRAATVAGALLGSAIARDAHLNRQPRVAFDGHDPYGSSFQRESVRYEQRCRTVSDDRRDDRVVGYWVTYEYKGRQFTTQTDRHPGRSLRVRVDVTPEH